MKKSNKDVDDIQNVICLTSDKESDDYLEMIAPFIGQIVIDFNSLESFLDEVICTMIDVNDDKAGIIIIDKKTFSQKVTFFERWSNLKKEQIGFEFDTSQIVLKLKQLAGERNAVVHADWENLEDDLLIPRKYIINKNGIKREYIQASAEELDGILEDISIVFNQLADYAKAHLTRSNDLQTNDDNKKNSSQ